MNGGHVTLQPGNDPCGFLCAAENEIVQRAGQSQIPTLFSQSEPGNHFPVATPLPCNSSASWVSAVAIGTTVKLPDRQSRAQKHTAELELAKLLM